MDITKIYLHTNPPKNEIFRFFLIFCLNRWLITAFHSQAIPKQNASTITKHEPFTWLLLHRFNELLQSTARPH